MKITQLYKEYVIRGWWKLPSYTGIISHGKVIMFHFHLNFLESLGKSHFPSNKNATDIGRNRSVHYEGGRWKEGQRLWESSERVKIFFAPRIHGNDIVEWCIWMICFFCLRKVSKYIIQSYRSFGGWKKRKKMQGWFWVVSLPWAKLKWFFVCKICDLQRLGDQQKSFWKSPGLHTLPRKSSKNH